MHKSSARTSSRHRLEQMWPQPGTNIKVANTANIQVTSYVSTYTHHANTHVRIYTKHTLFIMSQNKH